MKRPLSVLTGLSVALLVVPALSASAATKAKPKPKPKQPTTRTETWTYSGPSGIHTATGVSFTGTTCGIPAPCFALTTAGYETKVAFAADTSVAITVSEGGSTVATVCGNGELQIKPGDVIGFGVDIDPLCGVVPTGGTITFTITGLK